MVPGCLTGESEERETWTAESLRAGSSIERVPSGIFLETGGGRRDFGGTRFRSTPFSCRTLVVRAVKIARIITCTRKTGGTSSNVSDQPRSDLMKLESLILAQSERWR